MSGELFEMWEAINNFLVEVDDKVWGVPQMCIRDSLHGAGLNLKEYRYRFYPNNEKIHFLYLGRIMKEKGMDELFGAIERQRKDGCEFVLDLVGFFEEEYRKKVEHLQKEGIKSRRLCNDVPVCVC